MTSFLSKVNQITQNTSDIEDLSRLALHSLLQKSRVSPEELPDNLTLYLSRQPLQRILFLDQIYKQILDVHGSIFEFGVRWGTNFINLINLRSIYEPFNPTRRIIGFDTFNGFPDISEQDGIDLSVSPGSHGVTSFYLEHLDELCSVHESISPISHIKKYELVQGDAILTFPEYISRHPETIIALAYFDFDLYKPTKELLKMISPRLVKGSVLVFDELNYERFPGETAAFFEVLGSSQFKLTRSPYSGTVSYITIE